VEVVLDDDLPRLVDAANEAHTWLDLSHVWHVVVLAIWLHSHSCCQHGHMHLTVQMASGLRGDGRQLELLTRAAADDVRGGNLLIATDHYRQLSNDIFKLLGARCHSLQVTREGVANQRQIMSALMSSLCIPTAQLMID
jgi:hypothetical protein